MRTPLLAARTHRELLEGMPGIRVSFPGNHPSGASEQRGVDWRIRTAVLRETLANLSITGHLRCFSDQPVAEIVQCGEPAP